MMVLSCRQLQNVGCKKSQLLVAGKFNCRESEGCFSFLIWLKFVRPQCIRRHWVDVRVHLDALFCIFLLGSVPKFKKDNKKIKDAGTLRGNGFADFNGPDPLGKRLAD